MPADLPAIATFTEFAALAGWRRSYVTELRKAGRLVLDDTGRRVRVAESLARIEATRDPAKAAVAARHAATRAAASPADHSPGVGNMAPEAPPPPAAAIGADDRIGSSYQAARAVKERYLALDAKRAYESAIGKLIEADQVRHAVAAAATTLRTSLEQIPDTLAAQLAAESDETRIRALLAEAIELALSELSRQFAALAAPRQETA